MRWVGYMACMGANRNTYRALVVKLRDRNHLEYLAIGGN
jgi:hypothetical protein